MNFSFFLNKIIISDFLVKLHQKQQRSDGKALKNSMNHYEEYVKSGGEEFRVKRGSGFTVFDEMENKRQAVIRENVQTRKSYELRDNKSLSPLALIARKLTELVRAGKNKKEPQKRLVLDLRRRQRASAGFSCLETLMNQ